jgi:uncharacterized protein DUF1552
MQDLRMSRRALLTGVGTTALGVLLRPIMAYAQTGATPQRLLVIHRPCGTSLGTGNDGWWWPTGGTKGWTASPLLSSFTDGKLASLQNQMVVLKGLSAPRNMNWLGDKHGAGFLSMITPPVKDIGAASFPQSASATPSTKADANSKTISPADQSADQLFLNQIPALKGACPIPSVQLTASTESSDQTNDWHASKCTAYAKGPGGQITPLWPTASPSAAFMNYFGASTMGLNGAQIARAAAQNKSVLDFASGGLMNLQNQVPKSQLPKVQANLQAITQLEQMLTSSATMACMPPMTPTGGWLSPTADTLSSANPLGGSTADFAPLDQQTYPMWQQHKEIIKTLFQCDLTRVVSFTFGYGNNAIHFQNVFNAPPFVGAYKDLNGNPINDADGHHDISHNQGGDYVDAQYLIDKYYCDRTAELLAEMSMTKDVDGTSSLLDNTLVVFWNEISNGNAHGAVDMPVLLFGGKFLKLDGGSFLQLGSANSAQVPNGTYNLPSAPYMSDLWLTTAHAWGYNALTAYGDPMWNTGAISGIYG